MLGWLRPPRVVVVAAARSRGAKGWREAGVWGALRGFVPHLGLPVPEHDEASGATPLAAEVTC